MNANCGDLKALKKLGKGKKNDYTTEQLLDADLKNIYGESNLEVRKRMISFFNEIFVKDKEKRIAVISHGAAIKFFLQHFYNYEEGNFIFEGKVVCSAKLESPSVLKLILNNKELISINKINF